jgi:hypothetical protein
LLKSRAAGIPGGQPPGLLPPKGTTMRLKVILPTLKARPRSLAFQCDNGMKHIAGSIAADTLLDIMDFHRIKGTQEYGFQALLPEIERLVNAKSESGKFDENGELSIRTADLLRYGFRERDRTAA